MSANLGGAVASNDPSALALIDLGGGAPRTYSYADIDRLSNACARGLLRRGLRRGDRVAILATNRAEYLIAFLGTMRAGLVSVPVNHRLPAETVGFIIEDSDSRLVLTDRARTSLLRADVPRVVIDEDFASLLDEGEWTAPEAETAEPAMFLYTSGSTGRPKGVVLSHRSHLWVLGMRATPTPGLRVLVAAPLYHMNALSMSQVTLNNGGTIVLLPGFNAAGFIDAASRYQVNAITGVPTMIAMMLREHDAISTADLSSVQTLRIGSAPLSEQLIAQVRQAMPNVRILHGYGTTEAGPVAFGAPSADGMDAPPLSVGAPHPAVQVRLMRGRVAVDDEGVLEMRCPAVMNCYHKLPDVTRKAITPDGFYITGDVFRRDTNDFYYFVGRADDMFVCGGENIYPGEVEKMLERHPAVHQACVVPIPDELKAHKPVAFIVARPDTAVGEDEIRQFALAHAPAYQHPRRVWFLDELPLASTNKIDRKRLMQQAMMEVG
ncbi:MAG TPA: class I adenylate-forming enzyme family protein [Acetobacteraceae bacterium]|nr:class I adenylate-forming enzyme family protein [Acetobacteraceae bacterium]